MQISADVLQCLFEADVSRFASGKPEASVQEYAVDRQRDALVKKYIPDEGLADADSAAISLFLEFNSRCENFRMPSGETLLDEHLLGNLKDSIYTLFYRPKKSESGYVYDELRFSYHDIFRYGDIGPGASIAAKANDFYTKLFSSPLSCTDESLYAFYKQMISNHPVWSAAENDRQPLGLEVVRGSRLSLVPKTRKISRVICTEPILNMFFQKGIGGQLEHILKYCVGIDLSTQPGLNAEMARRGSIDGSFATIDLSSASDSISLKMCAELLPPYLFKWMVLSRCPKTVLPDGTEVELHMMSSMGNAFTFPLQTLIFTAVVMAAYKTLGIPIVKNQDGHHGNFGVFGDDIIVVKHAYDAVCRLLQLLSMKVNHDKSYNQGPFRESCGSDWYYGTNVRGVYIKSLSGQQDVYSAINRLNRWSTRFKVPLPALVSHLLGLVKFLPIPQDESDERGVKVPSSLKPALVPDKRHPQNDAYIRLESVERAFRVAEFSESRVPSWTVKSPDGYLLAAIAGRLRGGQLVPRVSGVKKTKYRKCYTPRWGYNPYARAERLGFGEDWDFFTVVNLCKID